MRTITQYEQAMQAIKELKADSDIQPNETVTAYVARLRQRSPEDIWVTSTIYKLRQMGQNMGHDIGSDNFPMADYWLRRIIEIIQDLKREAPVPTEFLASASAEQRLGQ